MKKFIFIPLAVLLLITTICIGNSSKVKEVSNTEHSLLYKISGNGLEKESYLFGTIHLMPKDDFFLPKGTQEAFYSAEILVLEIDVDIPLKEQIALATKIMLPDNQTLESLMSVEEYENFKSYCTDSLNIEEKKFAIYTRFKPFHMSGVLLTEYYGKMEAYEKFFSSRAKKQKMDILPLETIDFQLDLIDSIPLEEQAESIKDIDIKAEFNQLLNYYKSQNTDSLYYAIAKEENTDFQSKFLTQRNENWIPVLEENMKMNSLFIAVGAAHLGGEKGVIELLKNAGYTVEAVLQ